MGIPTTVITRKGFAGAVRNAFAGMGFPAEAPVMLEFPHEVFLPGSDLTPIEQNIGRIIDGLTRWAPEAKQTGAVTTSKVAVSGEDYQQAVDNMNHLFVRNRWADGLPVAPPTAARVDWILTGTDLPADRVIGRILPRGGIATVRMIAVSLAMAGGRPEYLPVLIAAVQAFVDPILHQQSLQSTTSSVYPVLVVNGPVARQIRLNSGYGALGPDPLHPAGASIGRGLRLVQMNLGGALPGSGTMSVYGGASRYTNVVFAEDEDGLPPGWAPLNVSYWGYPRGTNTVTVFGANSGSNIVGGAALTREKALSALHRIAGFMRAPNSNYYSSGSFMNGAPGMVLIARGTAQGFASALGFSKDHVKAFLWDNSRLPWSEMEKIDFLDYMKPSVERGMIDIEPVDPFPITARPRNIMIVVAGGEQAMHSYYMAVGHGPAGPAHAEIELPARWDELLDRAEKDLGFTTEE
ncbi:MAG: hypothetical protein HY673_25780 [Chloroflexi bacterium]|nr:hypothetical protein [Chloroflexota bacterium]